jgi:hypothetical protein
VVFNQIALTDASASDGHDDDDIVAKHLFVSLSRINSGKPVDAIGVKCTTRTTRLCLNTAVRAQPCLNP